MITNKPILALVDAVDCDPAPVSEFEPLGWAVERHRGYDDTSCIVLIPQGDDAEGPSFVLYDADEGIELVACRWDRVCQIGVYPTMEAVIEVIVLVTSTATESVTH